MAESTAPPRNALVGVFAVWVLAFLAAVAIGIFVPEPERTPWLILGFAGVVLTSFAVQLWYGSVAGFIFRVSASVAGGLLSMGAVSAVLGVAALIPG